MMRMRQQSSTTDTMRDAPRRRWARTAAATAALLTAASATVAATRAHARSAAAVDDPGVSVVANLERRELSIMNGNSVAETFPVAIGRGSKPTPPGHYTIRKIIWNPAWVPPDKDWAKGKKPQAPGAKGNPMRLVKIFFKEPDYYIHGTDDVESLGSAASHGCLRMDPDDAYRVARYLMENGGSPRDESWFWRVLHFRSETKTVYLDNPIPMTVE
ncbi:MAG TPA: L,D-transpeptidase [Gemmatimonadaceae bacterium]|nr:L,D-transpeptidase [Gemmatimonadaceae bacterium]